jgi:ribosomal 50S subunit-recycling heat shock protein
MKKVNVKCQKYKMDLQVDKKLLLRISHKDAAVKVLQLQHTLQIEGSNQYISKRSSKYRHF